MSRREYRSSNSKRHRSGFDRQPSPKRSRRDCKPATERLHSNPELDKDQLSSDQKHHRRLQDALPLEAPLGRDAKIEIGMVSEESEEKANGNPEGSNHPIDPAKVPRSRTYFQHDDRGITRQDGRGSGCRTDNERGWWRDHKAQQLYSRTDERMKKLWITEKITPRVMMHTLKWRQIHLRKRGLPSVSKRLPQQILRKQTNQQQQQIQ